MAIIQNLEAFVQSYPAGLDSVTDLQLSQNENGRQIRFTIGGVTIPAGSVATISGTKPDGVVYSNTGTIEGADTVIFDEDVQMTAVFGTWYAKIRITNAGNTIASARVRFIIDKDPVDAGAIPSESQLDGLVAEAEEYAEAAGDAAERAAITYGSPLTASTAAAMTDVNRVYVYTGSESGYTYGNWYYYNGSAWVSGGVYNSAAVETDTTLTESGVPADAKATGDKIAELKDDYVKKDDYKQVDELNSTFFTIGQNRYNVNDVTDGVRLNQDTEGTFADSSFTTSGFIYVGDLTSIKFYRRASNGSQYNDFANYVLYNADKERLGNRQIAASVDVSSAVWMRVSNSLQYKSSFMILDSSITPSAYIPFEFTFNYLTDEVNNKVDKNGVGQVNELNTTFFSVGVNKLNLNTVEDNTQLNQSSDGVHEQTGCCTSDYIDVSDLDSISFYRKNAAGTAMISESAYYILYNANKVMTATRALASTVNVSSASFIRITFSMADKASYMVCDSDYTVTDYVPYGYVFDYAEADKVVTINPSDDILSKLVANQGKDVFFADGNYDIIAIYKDYYGNDFFDNYSGYGSDSICRGIPVYQGTTMKFSPNAKFTANYTGSNVYVKMHFSAFAFEGGVTFDGINIEASGIRNIIHDDFDNNYVGTTIIKNCHFKHDYIIIAGGLALHELVEIYNNYFERTDTTTHVFDFSYHQNGTTGAQSEMIIKDNYCSKGISIRYYGSSTLLTDCLISNNSMANDIEYRAENETATIENMRVLKWNNEIRS